MKTSTNLRNRTSTVPPQRTISAIEDMLGQAGAVHIGKTYDNGEVVGFLFQLLVEGKPITFKLPCRWEPVESLLFPDKERRTWKKNFQKRKEANREQAKRTAWRLMHDWISVQLAMIQLEQAEAMQVFLPYAYDSANDMTFFDHIREGGFKQLSGPQRGQ